MFGDADNNVLCSEAICDAIIVMGHSCELIFSERRNVIRQLQATVVREEFKQRKDEKEPALERGANTKKFIEDWLIEHEVPPPQLIWGWRTVLP